jgi:hypothetical protein
MVVAIEVLIYVKMVALPWNDLGAHEQPLFEINLG